MKNNAKKMIDIVSVIIFALILGAFFTLTFYKNHDEILNSIKQQKNEETLTVNSVDAVLKQQLFGKDEMIEISGATKLLLGKKLSDDSQYFRGQQGMIHLNYGWRDYSRFLDDIDYLSGYLSEKEIPFLLCQIAERAQYPDGFSYLFSGNTLDYIQPLKVIVEENKGLYLDYYDHFSKNGFDEHDIFFKTDVHYKTEAEFSVFVEILKKLESEAGIVFQNMDIVSSFENFTVEKRPFLGNLGRTTGSLYSFGEDEFTHYIPKLDTDMVFINNDGTFVKSGSFEHVVMNHYRDAKTTDKYTYWVTDFLQFTNPYYTFLNNKVSENDILVISDSMAFRTISYLTLACHSVTVLDPRYFSNVDYLGAALKNDYDAVICFSSVNLSNAVGGYNAMVENVTYETDILNGSRSVSVTVRNNGTRVWSDKGVYICGLINEHDYGIKIGVAQDIKVKPGDAYKFVLHESDFPALFDPNVGVRFVMYDSYVNTYFGS